MQLYLLRPHMAKTECRRKQAKPIRRSMLIFHEPISSDNSRTLYENFDKETVVLFVSSLHAIGHAFVYPFKRKNSIVKKLHSSEIVLISASLTYVDNTRHTRTLPRGRYNPTSPVGAKRKRIQSYTSQHSTGHENAKEYKTKYVQ